MLPGRRWPTQCDSQLLYVLVQCSYWMTKHCSEWHGVACLYDFCSKPNQTYACPASWLLKNQLWPFTLMLDGICLRAIRAACKGFAWQHALHSLDAIWEVPLAHDILMRRVLVWLVSCVPHRNAKKIHLILRPIKIRLLRLALIFPTVLRPGFVQALCLAARSCEVWQKTENGNKRLACWMKSSRSVQIAS